MSPPLSNGSPTDKSEIPIWFPQSNVTKSNVTKPLLQIGFLTHWKERSGILVRRRGTGTAGFLIFRQFWLLPRRGGQTAARKVQTRFREYVRKIFPGEYGGQRNQRRSTTVHRAAEVEMAICQKQYQFFDCRNLNYFTTSVTNILRVWDWTLLWYTM